MTEPTPSEQAEAAAVRRRWLNLGELLAVVAVLISGLTLWNSYAERSHVEAEKAGEEQRAVVRAATLILRATPSRDGDRLSLAPADPNQSLQSQTVTFPDAIGVATIATTGEARIESGWFAAGLKRARKASGAKDSTAGDERLPVAIASEFVSDGTTRREVALYDLGYALEGRFLGGSRLRLRGLSRIGSAGAGPVQARLDGLWRARQPTISSGAKK